MKSTIGIGICAALFLCQCTTSKHGPENLIQDCFIRYEQLGSSPSDIKNHYEMIDLVCALPDTWEVGFPYRASHLDTIYKGGTPQDFIEVPEQGAQCEFTVIRLDKDLVAVTTHSDMDSNDGLRILRRVPCAWQDISDQAFPFARDKKSRIRGNRDKSLLVDGERYIWNGSSYVKG